MTEITLHLGKGNLEFDAADFTTQSYKFKDQAELDAFMCGVGAAVGWMEWHIELVSGSREHFENAMAKMKEEFGWRRRRSEQAKRAAGP
jgi:hypothetical protein